MNEDYELWLLSNNAEVSYWFRWLDVFDSNASRFLAMVEIRSKVPSTADHRHLPIARPKQTIERCRVHQLVPTEWDKAERGGCITRGQRYECKGNGLRSLQSRPNEICNSSRMLPHEEERVEPRAGSRAYAELPFPHTHSQCSVEGIETVLSR